MAHKGIYDNIEKLITDNIDFYKDRAAMVYESIEGSMTMEQIMRSVIKYFNIGVKTIYKYNMVERMLRSYVEYLNETGSIKLIMEDGFLKYTKCNTTF
ncbi:hypothetical protein [Clostridium sp.]|uniref:hypothetical protein n=1 Tax=Clostridium sp. TaxID=1506 RepID=UPI002FCC9FE9